MKLEGNVMIEHIHDLILKGQFKDAYEYSLANECASEEYTRDITCFRYLLACVNDEEYQPTEFSFTDIPQSEPAEFDDIRHRMDIMCQGGVFDQLRKLCKKYCD